MFSSLPPLAPFDAHSLWHPSQSSYSYHSNSNLAPNSNNTHSRTHQQHRSSHPQPPARTILSVLRADENAIEHRKANIRRFGAGWLKPPGVGKTLQGMCDEKAEREEQEANGLRELEQLEQARLLEEQAQAEEGNGDAAMLGDDESGADERERDLDEDIPDADEGPEWVDEDGDDGLPTEEGDGDYAEEEGMDGEGDMQGRDLDEDVPEAGSYQHTDTDVEDESSDMDLGGGRISLPPSRIENHTGSLLGSSVFGSSPVAQSSTTRRSDRFTRRIGREN
ncbi:hypothetical protein MMC17_005691 [Xylographa soralifera]|nr:hypothetical protein [Xylographa soralifera]